MSASEHPVSAYLDSPGPVAFAHRGGALVPQNVGIENTLAAFSHAVSLGYRYLETDVRCSADRVLYAWHDETLARLTGDPRSIADLVSTEIDTLELDGREPPARLATLLEAFPEARFNIDVKTGDAVEPVAELLEAHHAVDRVCLAAFSHRGSQRIRARLPTVATACSSREVAAMRFASWSTARSLRTLRGRLCLQAPYRRGRFVFVTPGFVARAHALELPVHVWTVDDATTMQRLVDMGVDGIFTDRTDILRDVLADRGDWRPA